MDANRHLTFVRRDVEREIFAGFQNLLQRFGVAMKEVDIDFSQGAPDLILLNAKTPFHVPSEMEATLKDTQVVFLDDDPPEHVDDGCWAITTADLAGGTENWRSLLQAIGRAANIPTLRLKARQVYDEMGSEISLDGDLAVELQQATAEADYKSNERYTLNFVKQVGAEFAYLVGEESYNDQNGYAYIAASYAQRTAEAAADYAREQLGKSFSHSEPNYAGVRWGRIKWPDTKDARNMLYEGETNGVNPHGYGILTLEDEGGEQTYLGQFHDGVRSGFGMGQDKFLVWLGAWRDDQPEGNGVLMQGAWREAAVKLQGRVVTEQETGERKFFMTRNAKMSARQSPRKKFATPSKAPPPPKPSAKQEGSPTEKTVSKPAAEVKTTTEDELFD